MGYQLVETIEVGSGGAASIEFTSIPQDGVDLVLKFSLRDVDAGTSDVIFFRINGSTADFTSIRLTSSGSAVSSAGAGRLVYSSIVGNGATSNTFSNGEVYLSNYAGSSPKSYSVDSVTENNATAASSSIQAGIWNNTSAITSLYLAGGGYNFMQHSTASLYKITAD